MFVSLRSSLVLLLFVARTTKSQDECATDLQEIQSNANLVNAIQAYTDLSAQRLSQCIANGLPTCTIATETETSNIKALCEEGNGDYEGWQINLNCRDAANNLWVYNIPGVFCFGARCSDAVNEADYTTLIDNTLINFQNDGLSCDYNLDRTDVSGGSTAWLHKGAILLMGIAAAFMTFAM
ncbi:hypothetical protein MPSEU_000976800 [Mayamaea pseudoterrestris]|nr:hypothetical protein MPSEU_000976800 [Mayamaea pseudoterrestris]